MQPKNIAHGYDLFTGKCEGNNTDDRYGEIHTGDAWEPARQQFRGNDNPINMPIALVIFADKSHLDLHISLSTLPIIFTLSCFNQESRNKENFWQPLTFLLNLSYGTLSTKGMVHAWVGQKLFKNYIFKSFLMSQSWTPDTVPMSTNAIPKPLLHKLFCHVNPPDKLYTYLY